jgi:hypothetical protein
MIIDSAYQRRKIETIADHGGGRDYFSAYLKGGWACFVSSLLSPLGLAASITFPGLSDKKIIVPFAPQDKRIRK